MRTHSQTWHRPFTVSFTLLLKELPTEPSGSEPTGLKKAFVTVHPLMTILTRVGVNSIPELELKLNSNSNSGIGIGIEIGGIENGIGIEIPGIGIEN